MNLAERASLHTGIETRACPLGGVELRESRSAATGLLGWELSGFASTFDDPYPVEDSLGEYTEIVRRGAFAQTLAARSDVIFRLDHSGMALARTTSGTLRLAETGRGLHLECDLDPVNPTAGAIRSAIERHDLDAFSFAFRATRQVRSSDYLKRELFGIDLAGGDCSIVAFPANPATSGSASLRSAYLAQVRAKYTAKQLEAMGKAGKAFLNPDGHYSFPIGDVADLTAAVKAVGRAGADHDKVRKWIIGRAKQMGQSAVIPSSWKADGSLKGAHGAGRLGEHRASVYAACNCCGPCAPGCDGGCCENCDSVLLAQANAVINAAVATESDDLPSSEALALLNYDAETRIRLARLRGGHRSTARRSVPPTPSKVAEIEARRRRELQGGKR